MKACEKRKALQEFVKSFMEKRGTAVHKLSIPSGGKKGVVFIINDEEVLRLYRNPLKFMKLIGIQKRLEMVDIQVAPRLKAKGFLFPLLTGYCAYSIEEFATALNSKSRGDLLNEAFWKLAILHKTLVKTVSEKRAIRFWRGVVKDTFSRLDYCAQKFPFDIRFQKDVRNYLSDSIPFNWRIFSLCHTDIAWSNMGLIRGSLVFFDWDRAMYIPPQFDFIQLAYVFNSSIEKALEIYTGYTGFCNFEVTLRPVEVVFLIKRMKRALKRGDSKAFNFYLDKLNKVMNAL